MADAWPARPGRPRSAPVGRVPSAVPRPRPAGPARPRHFPRRTRWDEVEGLEDEADGCSADLGELAFPQAGQVLAGEFHGVWGRAVESTEDLQQGALAVTGRALDGQPVTVLPRTRRRPASSRPAGSGRAGTPPRRAGLRRRSLRWSRRIRQTGAILVSVAGSSANPRPRAAAPHPHLP